MQVVQACYLKQEIKETLNSTFNLFCFFIESHTIPRQEIVRLFYFEVAECGMELQTETRRQ